MKNSRQIHWVRLIQATPKELVALRLSQDISSFELQVYHGILEAYFQKNLRMLNEFVVASHRADLPHLAALAQVRMAIRAHSLQENLIHDLLLYATDLYAGEVLYVAATAYAGLEKHDLSKDLFFQAYQKLWQEGAKQKALNALHNHVVEESHIFPEKRLIVDYTYVADLAKQEGFSALAGMALMNISREYELVGALQAALKACNEALSLMTESLGTLHYYLTIAHRCHLLIELGLQKEAEVDFETASICELSEVQSALTTLAPRIGRKAFKDTSTLTPTWKERTQTKSQVRLTSVESKIIQALGQGEKTTVELLETLSYSTLDFHSACNRLRVTISRIRKKCPGLILSDGTAYRLSSNEALLQRGKKPV